MRSKEKIEFWEQYEIVFSIARQARGEGIRRLLRNLIEPTEFWGYYGEERIAKRMPVKNHANIPLMRRLAGMSFGSVAKRRDLQLLYRMLGHWYWAVQRGAANALRRIGGLNELNFLVQQAIRRAEQGKDLEGIFEAICLLDRELFGKGKRELPIEASFGETRG
jgi:hypothetical protein